MDTNEHESMCDNSHALSPQSRKGMTTENAKSTKNDGVMGRVVGRFDFSRTFASAFFALRSLWSTLVAEFHEKESVAIPEIQGADKLSLIRVRSCAFVVAPVFSPP